ncbi:6-phosphogluconolactonase [Staphylococcus aureus]|uniref:6-phosphogluconolactonase n=1 Tax=Staphylococcus aureus TaxID=1280 RepID=A0A380DW87_STAAU|nr:6-phosphogluconolactonase [Staphylococcus aureus]
MTNGYIGSYTKKNGKGIYRFELNENQSRIDLLETGFELEASYIFGCVITKFYMESTKKENNAVLRV